MTIAGALGELWTRRLVVSTVLVGLLVTTLVGWHAARADGDDAARRCAHHAEMSSVRQAADVGLGARIVVIGDSYSVGLGLDRPRDSWPSRLPGRVHVAGFSGSGFSATSSPCGAVSYADRAAAAVGDGAALVVVEGGLNDVDRTDAQIRAGFLRLLGVLDGQRVLVVGPPTAPAREAGALRVDRLLAGLCAAQGISYVSTTDLDLAYLDDRLHLTAEGHTAFGDAVAASLPAR